MAAWNGSAAIVDQPALRVRHDAMHRAGLQAVGERAEGLRGGPDGAQRRPETRGEALLQPLRADVPGRQAKPQGVDLPRAGPLSFEQSRMAEGHPDQQAAAMLGNRIEHGLRIELRDQDQGHALTDPRQEGEGAAGMNHGHGTKGDMTALEAPMPALLRDLAHCREGMADEFGLARGAGCRQQQGGRAGIHQGGQGSGDDVGEKRGPGLHAKIGDTAIDKEARIDGQIHRVDPGDLGIEICLADVEGGPQAAEQGIQLGRFQAGVERRRDGPYSKAGMIGDRELRPVEQMEGHTITPTQAARDQAAREAVNFDGEARIAPDVLAHDEGGTLGAGFGVVTQSRDGKS